MPYPYSGLHHEETSNRLFTAFSLALWALFCQLVTFAILTSAMLQDEQNRTFDYVFPVIIGASIVVALWQMRRR